MEINGELIALNEEELKRLEMISAERIETVARLPESAETMLNEIAKRHNSHYHQLIWKLTGHIDTASIMEGYNRLLQDYVYLRTNYLFDVLDENVMVVYENTHSTFPIIDVSNMPDKKKMSRIVNITASEGRRTYNPQKSRALRIQALILEKDLMAVVISFIPELCKNLSKNELAKYVFNGMSFEQSEYNGLNNTAKSFNNTIREENLDYWENELNEMGKELLVPGSCENQTVSDTTQSAYKKMNDNLFKKISKYCGENVISKKTMFMYGWLSMLGSVNGTQRATLPVVGNYGEPNIYPVSINCSDNMKKMVAELDEKILNATDYGYINETDFDRLFGHSFLKRFNVQFYFLDLDKMQENENWILIKSDYLNDGINLTIKFDYTKNDCFISYIYNNRHYNMDGIELLHEKYEAFLDALIDCGKATLDTSSFKKVATNNEERKKELLLRVVNAIKKQSLFSSCSVNQVKMLASHCRIQSVSVDEEILREKETTDYLGLIALGKIEESCVDIGGLGRSIRIMSEGETIGLETLVNNNPIKRTYIVASNEAIIVWIPRRVVETVLNESPNLWKDILGYVYDRLWKTESIWLMD